MEGEEQKGRHNLLHDWGWEASNAFGEDGVRELEYGGGDGRQKVTVSNFVDIQEGWILE